MLNFFRSFWNMNTLYIVISLSKLLPISSTTWLSYYIIYLYQLTGYSAKWWKAGAREHLIEALWYAIQIHIGISEFPRMIFLSTTNPSKQLPLSMRRSLLKNEAHLPLKHESLPHPLKNEATSKDMISTKKP